MIVICSSLYQQYEYEKIHSKGSKPDKWTDTRGKKIDDDHPKENLTPPQNWKWAGKQYFSSKLGNHSNDWTNADHNWKPMPSSNQEDTDYEEYEESVYEYQFIHGSSEEPFWGDEVYIYIQALMEILRPLKRKDTLEQFCVTQNSQIVLIQASLIPANSYFEWVGAHSNFTWLEVCVVLWSLCDPKSVLYLVLGEYLVLNIMHLPICM